MQTQSKNYLRAMSLKSAVELVDMLRTDKEQPAIDANDVPAYDCIVVSPKKLKNTLQLLEPTDSDMLIARLMVASALAGAGKEQVDMASVLSIFRKYNRLITSRVLQPIFDSVPALAVFGESAGRAKMLGNRTTENTALSNTELSDAMRNALFTGKK